MCDGVGKLLVSGRISTQAVWTAVNLAVSEWNCQWLVVCQCFRLSVTQTVRNSDWQWLRMSVTQTAKCQRFRVFAQTGNYPSFLTLLSIRTSTKINDSIFCPSITCLPMLCIPIFCLPIFCLPIFCLPIFCLSIFCFRIYRFYKKNRFSILCGCVIPMRCEVCEFLNSGI